MRKRRQGFSLIELTAVILMIAIFAIAVVVSMGTGERPGYLIRSLARQVAGKMEQARLLAANTGRLVRIVYDLDEQMMMVYSQRKLAADEEPEDFEDIEDMLQGAGGLSFADPSRAIELSPVWLDSVEKYDGEYHNRSGQTYIDIRPVGTPIGHVVTIANSDGEVWSIELNPLTGTARIYSEPKRVEKPQRD